MTDLIATLEGLTSPSREVDARIWAHFAGVKYVSHNPAYSSSGNSPLTQVEFRLPPKRTPLVTRDRGPYRHATPVTASLDAITALVERVLPGWSYEVRKSGFGNGQAALWNPTMQPRPGLSIRADHASSPAIALCIALLRALEARDGTE